MEFAGIQKLTLLDYPDKMACILFTQGCNLDCLYCHNSQLIPFGTGALREEEVLSFLTKRAGVLEGVVVTGGEPLLQKDLDVFLRTVKNLGYTIKIDTNGTLPQALSRLLDQGLIDYIAMDLKAGPTSYPKTTNREVEWQSIMESLSLIRASGVLYELRITIAKELFDKSDLTEIQSVLRRQDPVYLQAFKESEGVRSFGLHAPTDQVMAEYKSLLSGTLDHIEVR